MYKKINSCRVCGNKNLDLVLDLGVQSLTGVFPKNTADLVTEGPLRLVKCRVEMDECGLLQLEHSYDTSEMYGDNYGYRSGLNSSMVKHLQSKVKNISKYVSFEKGDLVLDIGSNDSTTLQSYSNSDLHLVGIDPTGRKFSSYYPDHIKLIPDYFSASLFNKYYPSKKAKVITSFSMFYDLENPLEFMGDVYDVLDDNGIWVFEQSYMPAMLDMNSYDTVCHEHLEYYSLKQIKWMADKVGFVIESVEFNEINGGSFSVSVSKKLPGKAHANIVHEILEKESELGLDSLVPYKEFSKRVSDSKLSLISFISRVKSNGESIAVLGASTKGNVLLQYCGVTSRHVSYVGEVNSEKFGAYTPGTLIPIVDENNLIRGGYDYLLVLPWHFKQFFMSSTKFKGSKLVFPLPNLHVVDTDNL